MNRADNTYKKSRYSDRTRNPSHWKRTNKKNYRVPQDHKRRQIICRAVVYEKVYRT